MAVESIKITNTDTDTDTDPDPDLPLVLSCKRRKEDDVEEDPKEFPYRKRRRLEEEEEEPDPDDSIQLPEFIKIEELPDAILFEILYRLPCRWALQCKSVSKRWCSVISHPLFVRNAMLHRLPFSKSNTDPFTLVLYHAKKILALPFDEDCGGVGDGDGDGDGLDFLNFLPCIEFARKNYPFCVEASFNDLLLIRSEVLPIVNSGFTEYYICNPITKQWIILPRLPYQGYRGIVLVGFICIPDSCDKEQGCITNAHYSYRVVRIYSPTQSNSTQIRMQIFSSDTGEWCDSLVSSPRGFNSLFGTPQHAGVVACNGVLHWVDENDRMIRGFVVFDPFNNAQGCRYIDPPIDLSLGEWVSFGVFQGRLRIFQDSSLQYSRSFSVWELEDYNNAGTWCLKYKIYFKDMVSEYSDLLKMAKEKISTGSLLAFHPNVGEFVFLQFRKCIVLCNMRTRVLTMAGRLEKLLPCKSIYSSNSIPAKYVFLVGQPSWPTPVPLPLKFECPSPFLWSEFVSKRQKQKKQRQEVEKLRAAPTPIPLHV
ncbi:F-box protein At5g07610-like isoform X1 [Quercus robur]|uniref:F-box protein At5g07610-like isoform X1 n=1 Tax=Quercus robur TaxID=38942 RepID=UPI002162C4CA|nr:F-box protein At5g07610-like isoform X1 [Quercus robur]